MLPANPLMFMGNICTKITKSKPLVKLLTAKNYHLLPQTLQPKEQHPFQSKRILCTPEFQTKLLETQKLQNYNESWRKLMYLPTPQLQLTLELPGLLFHSPGIQQVEVLSRSQCISVLSIICRNKEDFACTNSFIDPCIIVSTFDLLIWSQLSKPSAFVFLIYRNHERYMFKTKKGSNRNGCRYEESPKPKRGIIAS